jgi:hypothetical protein
MLWYKSWLETRWRFLIGLPLLICSAAGIVLLWPKVADLAPLAAGVRVQGEIGRQLREAVELSSQYRGYVWSQWFRQNMPQMGTLFAVLLGTGGLLSQHSGALFTLSLPISRKGLVLSRAALGLAELFLLVFVPSLLIPFLSPAVGKSYSIEDTLMQGACMFITASVFFSFSLLLSTVFNDVWRPLMIALSVAVAMALSEQFLREVAPYGIFRVMRGETWFRTGVVPWPGLLASAATSAAMLYGAAINIARRDF